MARKKNYEDWEGCPLRYAAGILGDRWSLLILRDLMFKGHRRYRDFLSGDEGIATNVLAGRLLALEKRGILCKRPDPAHSARATYHLTSMGLDLLPTVLELIVWAEKYDSKTEVPAPFISQLEENKEAFLQKIRADITARDLEFN